MNPKKLDYVGNKKNGSPLWDVYQDPETGKTTYEELTPTEVPMCSQHTFEYTDTNGNYHCVKCPIGGHLVLAFNQIKDGKIINLASKKEVGLSVS